MDTLLKNVADLFGNGLTSVLLMVVATSQPMTEKAQEVKHTAHLIACLRAVIGLTLRLAVLVVGLVIMFARMWVRITVLVG